MQRNLRLFDGPLHLQEKFIRCNSLVSGKRNSLLKPARNFYVDKGVKPQEYWKYFKVWQRRATREESSNIYFESDGFEEIRPKPHLFAIYLKLVALAFTFVILLYWNSAQAQVKVEMTADRTQITTDQQVVIQIDVEANGTESPEIELPSFNGFEIVQQQVSRPMQFSFSFGSNQGTKQVVKSSTKYIFVLRPFQEGAYVIPEVLVKLGEQNYKSNRLTILVGKGSQSISPDPQSSSNPSTSQKNTVNSQASDTDYIEATDFDRQAFLRTVVDKKEAFVSEQVTVTIYLYVRARLHTRPSIETEPNTDGFWIHDLSVRQEPMRQVVKGIPFRVYVLRRFAAFPLRPGELTIGSMTVDIERGSLFDLFNHGIQPNLRRASVPLTILVKDIPKEYQSQGEVAVGNFSLTAKLDRTQAPTGDAVKLTVTVNGTGNIQTVHLPDLKINRLQVLPPETRDLVESPNDLVVGTRVYEWLLIPHEPGRIQIGSISLPTFDPNKEKFQLVQSQPLELTAVGKALQNEQGKVKTEEGIDTDQVEQISQKFGPIRISSALLRERTRILKKNWYPWLLLLPPFSWLFFLGSSLLRRRLQVNSKKAAPRKAIYEAKQRLFSACARVNKGDTDNFYAQVSSAFTKLLETQLDEAIGGYTLNELTSQLLHKGMEESLARKVIGVLEKCDLLRFSSNASLSKDVAQDIQEFKKLFRQIQSFQPIRTEKGTLKQ